MMYTVRYKYYDSEVIYRETYSDLKVALFAYEELENDIRRIECCMMEDSNNKILASR